jgi:hypothetical protein
MAKVIVERPRYGGGIKFPRGSARSRDRIAPDDWHRRESMKRPWGSGRKELNENLAPLRRYLRSNVGKPWDKVYADICQRINRNSAVQLHIWQHLVHYVCTDPHVVGGEVCCSARAIELFEFFVHPVSGRLCLNDKTYRWRRKNRQRELRTPGDQIITDRGRHYRRINSFWHEVKFAPLPDRLEGVYDALLEKSGGELTRDLLCRVYPTSIYRRHVYCYARRQLTLRDARRVQAILDDRAREENARQRRPGMEI